MRFRSLRLRLLLGAAAFILTALALAASGLTFLFQNHMERWVDAELNAYLDQVIAGIDKGPGGNFAVTAPPADPRFDQPLSGRYWQVTVEPGGTVLRSRSLWDTEIPVPRAVDGDGGLRKDRVPGPNGTTLYLLRRDVRLPARLGGHAAQAVAGIDAAEVSAAVRRFASVLVPFLLVLSGLLILAAWVQVRIGLRPLAAIQGTLGEVASGKRARLGGGFPDEVQPLATEIDQLLDGRDREVERGRSRAADLAHGLKTPLQVLLSDAEQLKRKGETEVAAEIETIVTALQRHTERQLSRARMASYAANASADIGAVAEQVIRVMKRTPEGRLLAWSEELPAGMTARIDPNDLSEAIGNLSENAARHARSEVSVTAYREGASVVVAVADDGPGIPMERWDEVLDRGTRLDSAGAGTGLGLAIVKDIAEAWGAEIAFGNAGQRFEIRLVLPAR